MKIKVKYLAIPIVAFVLGVLISLTIIPSNTPVVSEGIKYSGYVCVFKNNELVECKHNILVNNGKTWIQDKLGSGAAAGVATVIALGNGTGSQSASDTALPGIIQICNLVNATGTYVTAGAVGAWNITYQWTSNCVIGVNSTGLYNGTTQAGTILFAETNFTSVSLQANDKLNVTWGIDVTG